MQWECHSSASGLFRDNISAQSQTESKNHETPMDIQSPGLALKPKPNNENTASL